MPWKLGLPVRRVLDKLSRGQDPAWIEGLFHLPMQLADPHIRRLRPPALFREANPVLAGDGATPIEDLTKEIVQGGLRTGVTVRLREVDHDVDVDVAVAGMAKGRD